jgi:hypothetical protein
MIVGSLNKQKHLDGFYDGLIDTRLIRVRHDALAAEMLARGYRHASPLPAFVNPKRGRLNGEGPQSRCEAYRKRGIEVK